MPTEQEFADHIDTMPGVRAYGEVHVTLDDDNAPLFIPPCDLMLAIRANMVWRNGKFCWRKSSPKYIPGDRTNQLARSFYIVHKHEGPNGMYLSIGSLLMLAQEIGHDELKRWQSTFALLRKLTKK